MVAKALDLPVSSPTVSGQADPIHVIVPFKHQGSAHIVCAQIKDLTQKIHTTVQSVFCQPEDLEILACKTTVYDVKEWIQMRVGNVKKKENNFASRGRSPQPNDVMLGKHHILLS